MEEGSEKIYFYRIFKYDVGEPSDVEHIKLYWIALDIVKDSSMIFSHLRKYNTQHILQQ